MKIVNEISSFRSFARTTTSAYLTSAVEGSYEIVSKDEVEHFVIYNLDNAVEVIADKSGILRRFRAD